MAETKFRIFNENYIDEDILANFTESSEDSSFPIENAFNQQRRSKVWRSDGYWKITTANNILIFRETLGSDLTATIEPGEYTTTDAFILAIKTAMELTGASTYTITHVGLQFYFLSNGAGGGGVFQLYLSSSTIASDIGLTADHTGALFYLMNKIIIHQEEWIEWDMGVVTNPDAFILVDQRNSPIKISPGATIQLQANETGNFDDPGYSESITYDDEVFSILSEDGVADTAYRYWRFRVVDQANPNGFIQVGAFFLGNFMKPERGRANYPFNQAFVDRTVTVFSQGGQTFADIKEKSQSFAVQIKGLQKADVEEFKQMWDDFGTGKPFFISMDSGAVYSSSANRMIRLVKFASEPSAPLISPDNFTIGLNLREEL